MVKLSSFLMSTYSQNVGVGPGGVVPQLTGPIMAIRPRYIPSEFSFSLTIGISGLDLQSTNKMSIQLVSPSGIPVFALQDDPIPQFNNDSILPAEYQGVLVTFPLTNIALQEEGCYDLNINVNGERIDSVKIPVYRIGVLK